MKERRYSRYKQADVWATLYQQQSHLDLLVHDGTVVGNSVELTHTNIRHKAVVLARSSDWYRYSLNCVERWKHSITCIVCGTHDSCVPVLVVALDTSRWYNPCETRLKGDTLEPKLDSHGRPVDAFEGRRRSHYGHNILIGALMCGRVDAVKRLLSLPPSTRFRIEAELRRLHMRRPGRPLSV
jgi:hypothetical protein